MGLSRRRKTILLLESNAILVMDIKETLRDIGCAVEIARDRAEALEKINQRKTYDFIIVNNRIPQIDGEEFYTRVSAQDKDLAKKIIFISEEVTEFIKSTGNPFLVKPFAPDQLVKAIQGIIH